MTEKLNMVYNMTKSCMDWGYLPLVIVFTSVEQKQYISLLTAALQD
jgi:hypothetical protein